MVVIRSALPALLLAAMALAPACIEADRVQAPPRASCDPGDLCDDGDPCTEDRCDEGLCAHDPIASCEPCADAAECAHAGACETATCPAGRCLYARESGCLPCDDVPACDDGDACTIERCDDDLCHYDPLSCDDGDPCTGDACDPASGCTYAPLCPPTLAATLDDPPAGPHYEGAPITLTGSVVDPDGGDDLAATLAWGADATPVPLALDASGAFVASHTFGDDGDHNVTLTATRGEARATAALTLEVLNVAPILSAPATQSLLEGTPAALDLLALDPGADTLTATVDRDDGAGVVPVTVDAAGHIALDLLYPRPGEHTVTIQINDGDGGQDSASFLVEVTAAPPVIAPLDDAIADEGAPLTVPVTFDDPGDNAWVAEVSFGDGTGLHHPAIDADAQSFTLEHAWANDGAYLVLVRVTDDHDATHAETFQVAVANVPPTPNAGADATVEEGAPWTRDAVGFDPGAGDLVTGDVHYGDHEGPAEPLPVDPLTRAYTLSRTYPQEGAFDVAVTLRDNDGGEATETFTLTVTNVPPLVDCGGPAALIEGEPFARACTFTDPGADAHSAVIDFGDGTPPTSLDLAPHGAFDLNHTYLAAGLYTVTVAVNDGTDDGVATFAVQVGNGPPIVDAGPDATLAEGAAFARTGFVFDLGTSTVFDATVDYGDGGGPVPLTVDEDRSFTLSHTWTQDGVYAVAVAVTDVEGDTGHDGLVVTVTNAAPVVHAGADVTVAQGAPLIRDVVIADPGLDDLVHVAIDLGDGDGLDEPLGGASGVVSLDHTYRDAGVYEVAVVATDDAEASGYGGFTVTVMNAAPIVHAGPDAAVDEGARLVRDVTFDDVGEDGSWSATLDPGDGSSVVALPSVSPGVPFTLDHVYVADGLYTVTVEVDDGDAIGTDTFVVDVANVPPSVDLGGPGAVDEGATWTRVGAWSDPGLADVVTATVDYGAGAGPEPLALDPEGTFTLAHAWPGDGDTTVTVRLFDGADPGEDSIVVTVANVAPVVTATAPTTVTEGASLTVSASFVDPGADTWTASIDWGDGGAPATVPVKPDKTLVASHTYLDDGEHTVVVTVHDGVASGSDSVAVEVTNAPPVVSAGGSVTLSEGATLTRAGAFADPGPLDTFTATVDYGTGDGAVPLTATPERTFALSHVYPTSGVYDVLVTVTDDDEGVGTGGFTVTVSNTAPIVDAGPDASLDEGATLTRLATFTDDGEDAWTAEVDYGDGLGFVPATLDPAARTVELDHLYPQDGVYTVSVAVDDGTEVGLGTFTLAVDNVAPTVDLGAPTALEVDEGAPWTRPGSFVDPGPLDAHAATLDPDDGSGARPLALEPDRTFVAAHTWPDDGEHTVVVTVSDEQDAGDASLTVTVKNVAPTIAPVAAPDLVVGQRWQATATFADPGADTWTLTADYGDGSAPTTGPLVGRSFAIDHAFGALGDFTATFTVTDDDGGADTVTVPVSVGNAPPQVDAGPDLQVFEGAPLTLVATFTDPADPGPHTATIAWTPGAPTPATVDPDAGTASGAHTFPDDAVVDVVVAVTDPDGATGQDSARVTVVNVAPTVTIGDVTVDPTGQLEGEGSFADPGADTWTVSVDWGDGGPVELIDHEEHDEHDEGDEGDQDNERRFDLAHQYLASGRYTVRVTVTDDDGGVGSASREVKATVLDCAGVEDLDGTYWVGGASVSPTAWSAPSNWFPASVPDAGTDVIICGANAHYPALTSDAAVRDLRLAPAASASTGGRRLTVGGDLVGGQILGPGVVVMAGDGVHLATSTPELRVEGEVLATSDVTVSGPLVVESGGTLRLDEVLITALGAVTVWVGGDAGGLVLDEAGDELVVHGLFSARNTADLDATSEGSYSDGLLRLRGGLEQIGNNQQQSSLVVTGTHVRFEGAAAQSVRFDTPAVAASRLAGVTVGGSAQVTLLTNAAVTGAMAVEGTATVSGGRRLFVTSALPTVAAGATWSVGDTVVVGSFALSADVALAHPEASVSIEGGAGLTVGPHALTVGRDLRAVRTGNAASGLLMGHALSRVEVLGDANFVAQGNGSGGDALSAGVLTLRGDFTQSATTSASAPVAFVPKGTLTVFDGGGTTQIVRFDQPNANRFGPLALAPGARVELASDATSGQLRIVAGAADDPPHIDGPFHLAAGGADVDGLYVTRARLTLDGARGQLSRFDRVVFDEQRPDAVQLTVRAETLAATFVDLAFLVTPSATGLYLLADDLRPEDAAAPVLTLAGATPQHGLPRTQTTGQFIVHWGSTDDDTDGDGLPDHLEFAWGTDVLDPDSDDDGFLDGTEAGVGSSPTDALSRPFTLGKAAEYAVGAAPVHLAVGDIDGDGHLDLAVADEGSSTVTVRYGQAAAGGGSAGTFGAPVTVAFAPDAAPRAVAIAELAPLSPGRELVVALHGEDRVVVLTRGGSSGPPFVVSEQIALCKGPTALYVGLLDGDFDTDIAAACHGEDTVGVALRTLSLTLPLRSWKTTTYPVGAGPVDLAAGRLNADSLPDLVTANLSGGSLSFLANRATDPGTFELYGAVSSADPSGIAIADVNGDDKRDVVWVGEGGAAWALLGGSPGGTPLGPFAVGLGARGAAIADLVGNGAPDLATAATADDTVSFVLQGVGGFAGRWFPHAFAALPDAGEVHAVLRDVDGDGEPDLLIVNQARDSVVVYRHVDPAVVQPVEP